MGGGSSECGFINVPEHPIRAFHVAHLNAAETIDKVLHALLCRHVNQGVDLAVKRLLIIVIKF